MPHTVLSCAAGIGSRSNRFGWHEETKEVSKKAAGVVVIKQMFHPKEFDEDATYLTDIRV